MNILILSALGTGLPALSTMLHLSDIRSVVYSINLLASMALNCPLPLKARIISKGMMGPDESLCNA